MRLALLWLLASGCDSCLPEGWRVPEARKFEIRAIERHQSCVQNHTCAFLEWCHQDSADFCLDAGYPATCGNAEVEGSCGMGVK